MAIIDLYRNCQLCPRSCGVDRLAGETGFCGESAELRLASAVLHRGEEPPLLGAAGSGTVFVSGCNLGCVFCQNYQISRGTRKPASGSMGRAVSSGEFAAICLELQNRGAANVNIVTGSHAVPAIVRGLQAARQAGLVLPALWNSSGYESLETLEMLNGHINIFLPDLKTLDSALAGEFFNAPDYPRIAQAAILNMIGMSSGKPDNTGGALNVIIRHLILPGRLDSTRAVLRWFAENANGRALLSLMSQYTPPVPGNVPQSESTPQSGNAPQSGSAPQSFVNEREYETVLGWLDDYGIEDGFCQELVTGSDWLPDFGRANPFSPELAVPVWHWRDGLESLGN